MHVSVDPKYVYVQLASKLIIRIWSIYASQFLPVTVPIAVRASLLYVRLRPAACPPWSSLNNSPVHVHACIPTCGYLYWLVSVLVYVYIYIVNVYWCAHRIRVSTAHGWIHGTTCRLTLGVCREARERSRTRRLVALPRWHLASGSIIRRSIGSCSTTLYVSEIIKNSATRPSATRIN